MNKNHLYICQQMYIQYSWLLQTEFSKIFNCYFNSRCCLLRPIFYSRERQIEMV